LAGAIGAGAGAALLPGLGNRPGGDNRPGVGQRPNQLPNRTPQERRDNLQDRLASGNDNRDQRRDDRQNNRDQRRDDWQNNRDQVREDWQDRYENFYNNHEDWHHGYWHGNYGDWWNHMWDDHTALMAFGTTMWGINRAAWAFGYWGYSNPYYTESYPIDSGVVLDYSQPIAIDSGYATTAAPTTTTPEATAAPAPGMADFDAARQSFYQGDYSAALASTNKALAAMPNDPIIHEFRALVMFAQGKYKEAAAGLYSVLSVGPGWDWTTLSSLYPNVDTYTKQLRALETYATQHPQATDARFVLAYHYLTCGSTDAATTVLKDLYKQTPQDNLVKQLLLMTGGPDALGVPASAVASTAAAAPAVPPADLVGNWSASGQGNTKFAMELTKDGNFSWTFTEKGRPQSVKGVYAVDQNVLAMEPESGGVMLAQVTPPQGGRFDFQLLGGPPGDPGLKFAKSR
jgi:tetratricopeptide (TPR) repeat protein